MPKQTKLAHLATSCSAGPYPDGVTYRPDLADHAVDFFSNFLCHSKSKWRGKPFKLLPWQEHYIIRPLFGFVDANGLRVYRRASVWVPKKNGKSTLAAGIGLYSLIGLNEGSAEVYSVAADRDQAKIVHGEAVRMVENSPLLEEVTRIHGTTHTIHFDSNQSLYKALSSEAHTKEGLNISCALIDELHAWKGHELWNTLLYGTAARPEPLIFVISTAGVYDPESIGWQQYEYAKKVATGKVTDHRTLVFIAEAPADAEWTDSRTWEIANPSYGPVIQADEMADVCQMAQDIPRLENEFKRYRLNLWTKQADRWLSMEQWQKQPEPCLEWARADIWGGLDLASSEDLTAFALFGTDGEHFETKLWYWCPAQGIEKRDKFAPYTTWTKQGHLKACGDLLVDYDVVREDILAILAEYSVHDVAFDPWNATQLALQIAAEGYDLVKFNQTPRHYNEACRKLEDLIQTCQLRHGGHPILAWNAANAATATDSNEHMMPSKRISSEKIDGLCATLMAIGRYCATEATPRGSDIAVI